MWTRYSLVITERVGRHLVGSAFAEIDGLSLRMSCDGVRREQQRQFGMCMLFFSINSVHQLTSRIMVVLQLGCPLYAENIGPGSHKKIW
jgi:hypothetical protein